MKVIYKTNSFENVKTYLANSEQWIDDSGEGTDFSDYDRANANTLNAVRQDTYTNGSRDDQV